MFARGVLHEGEEVQGVLFEEMRNSMTASRLASLLNRTFFSWGSPVDLSFSLSS